MNLSAAVKMLGFIAWRNVWRNPLRSVLTASSLASGLALVIFYTAILEGMTEQMAEFATDISIGHIQLQRKAFIDDQDVYATLPENYQSELEAQFPAFSFAPRLYAAGLASSHDYSTGVLIKAINQERENQTTRLLEQLKKGGGSLSRLRADNRYPVFVGAQLARNQKIDIGDELILVTQAVDGSIGNDIFIVRGIFKAIEPNFDRTGVLMSIAAFRQLMYLDSGFHELVVKTENVRDVSPSKGKIQEFVDELVGREALDEFGGPVVVRTWREIASAVADMLEMSKSMIWILGFIILCLSSLGVINTILMAVYERKFEFGVLLAVGMKSYSILFMILLESLFIGLFASMLGCVMGVALVLSFGGGIDFSALMPNGFDWGGMIFDPVLRLKLEYQYLWMASLVLLIITLLAALLPSWKIVTMKPAEVI